MCSYNLIVNSEAQEGNTTMSDIFIRSSKIKKSLFVALFVMLFSGCVASPKEKGVRIGMTQDQVLQLAGNPTRKSTFPCPEGAKNCLEIWKYDGYNVSFSDGVVDATQ